MPDVSPIAPVTEGTIAEQAPVPPAALHGPTRVVIKFGGTSLATPRRVRLAALRVQALHRDGHHPVVVVSAAGQSTDRLLRQWRAVTDEGCISVPALAREADRYLATGEDRSASLLAGALLSLGVPAVSLGGGEAGIRATGAFGAAVPESLHPDRLRQLTTTRHVPVVAGFQASREDGEVVTLGRGGSDLSAVFLAVHLGAPECRIVTDVAGVYTADPRRDPRARLLSRLSHQDLVRLTAGGAVVVQDGAARCAARSGLPLRIFHYRAPIRNPGGSVVGVARAGRP